MNEMIDTPDERIAALEGRKPWRPPTLQRLDTHAAGSYKGASPTDGGLCPGSDMGHTCS